MAVLSLFAVNLLLIENTHWILTEIPFLFFFLLSLLLFQDSMSRGIRLFLASLAIVMSYYIRSIGVALLIATPLFLIFKREFKQLIFILFLFVILVSPWILRGMMLGEEGVSYTAYFLLRDPYDVHSGQITFSQSLSRIGKNAKFYSTNLIPKTLFPKSILPPPQKGFSIVLAPLILGVLVLGFVVDLKKGVRLEHPYLIFYSAILLLWPQKWSSPRFLIPILPFLFLYFALGVMRILQVFKGVYPRVIFSLLMFILFSFHLKTDLQRIPRNLRMLNAYLKGDLLNGYPSDWRNFFEVALWARENIPEDSVVLSRKPKLFYLYSQRKSLVYPFSMDREEVYRFIRDNNVDYVVVDALRGYMTTPTYLTPVLQKYSKEFETIGVTKSPQTFFVKFHRSEEE